MRPAVTGAWLAALLLACSGDPTAPGTGSTPPPGTLPPSPAVVSASPTPSAPGVGSFVIGDASVAWVSMPPGTDTAAASVVVVNKRGGPTVEVLAAGGGFDPVAIPAVAGDTLVITVRHHSGALVPGYARVPLESRPIIVRTSPPNRKTDVPLNAAILVVFSEPMDSASLHTAISLRRAGSIVPGTTIAVGGASGSVLSATFLSTDPLEPLSTYDLVVDTTARNPSGATLATRDTSSFTTGGLLPTALTFQGRPTDAFTGMSISPAPRVAVQNDHGGVMTSFNGPVTLEVAIGPGGLDGTTTVNALNGIAEFPGVSVALPGAYVLRATSPGALPDTAPALNSCVRDCWLRTAQGPGERYFVASIAVGSVIYAAGGMEDWLSLSTLESYDPAANSWNARARMPIDLAYPSPGAIGEDLYLLGGYTDNNSRSSLADQPGGLFLRYRASADAWTVLAPGPLNGWGFGIGTLAGKLYAVGGAVYPTTSAYDLPQALNALTVYDPATDQWASLAPMPTARSHAGVFVWNGKVYALGGYLNPDGCGSSPTGAVEAYDPTTDTWATLAPMPRPGAVEVAALNGILYVLDDSTSALSTYDPSTGAWQSKSPIPFPMTGCFSPSLSAVDGLLYAVYADNRDPGVWGAVTMKYRP
jgi:hypothetical protein